jgi:hypothetical protein
MHHGWKDASQLSLHYRSEIFRRDESKILEARKDAEVIETVNRCEMVRAERFPSRLTVAITFMYKCEYLVAFVMLSLALSLAFVLILCSSPV